MRILLTVLVFLATLIPSALAAFFGVMLLVGPHGGVLPASLEAATLSLGWVFALGIPLLFAWRTWHRYTGNRS